MNLIYDEEYWLHQFSITREDLDQLARQLEKIGLPQDLKAIALPILKERIERGPELRTTLAGKPAGDVSIRLWDPADSWTPGDLVLIAHDPYGNSKYKAFIGEVMYVDLASVEIRIDELQRTEIYQRAMPMAEKDQKPGAADQWQQLFSIMIERKLACVELDEQAEGILLKYGNPILACLVGALRQDARFLDLEGKWFLVDRLPPLECRVLQSIHQTLLQEQPAAVDDLIQLARGSQAADVSLLKMAVHHALQQAPDRFANIGTPRHPRWAARLPAHDQAEVIQFAFDPQTFEILCRPGQRLSKRKACRLQELNLYAHVVTFSGWNQLAQR